MSGCAFAVYCVSKKIYIYLNIYLFFKKNLHYFLLDISVYILL